MSGSGWGPQGEPGEREAIWGRGWGSRESSVLRTLKLSREFSGAVFLRVGRKEVGGSI